MRKRFNADSKKRRCTSPVAEITEDAVKNDTHPVTEIIEDGILCSMLSSLTIRDAVRTSTLSSRWRHLWTHRPNLKFDDINMFGKADGKDIPKLTMEEQENFLEKRTNDFIGRVDKFLQHHRGTGVQTFTVRFFLHKKHTDHLDRWVDFGITSGANSLCLVLRNWYTENAADLYDFPYKLFAGGRGSSVERLSLTYCVLLVPPNFDGLHSLKELDLAEVSIDEIGIQDLLSTCLALESLTVERCYNLVNLRVSNPLGKLKYLHVDRCPLLEEVEVFAINLTKFVYYGCRVSFLFRNAPQLTRAFIGFDDSCDTVEYVLTGLHGDLPLLETLFLRINGPLKTGKQPLNSITFTHLKHLMITMFYKPTNELIWMASILSAAPFLKKFQLNFHQWCLREIGQSGEMERKESDIRRLPKCNHNHLKEIEITGFTGSLGEIEFAIYMLNIAVALEVMTIASRIRCHAVDFSSVLLKDRWPLSRRVRNKTLAYLLGEVPPGAKLEFL